jgi:hypothetical protein
MVGQWWDNGGTMVGQSSDFSDNVIVRTHRLHHHLVGQWWDNGGTMVEPWWDHGKTRRNGFLVSKCDTVVSVALASNCTSLRVCVATVGEMSVGSVDVSNANNGKGRHRRMRMRILRV